MKLNFLSLGLTLMTTVLLGNVAVAANEAEIKKIRKWYSQVQGDKSLKKTTIKTGEDEAPHSVTLTRYSAASRALRKLHITYGGEHGVEDVTYYYQDGSLFFIYSA